MKTPSLRGLIAFLRKQPRDATFDYLNNYDCVGCQYLKSLGYTDTRASSNYVGYTGESGLRQVWKLSPKVRVAFRGRCTGMPSDGALAPRRFYNVLRMLERAA